MTAILELFWGKIVERGLTLLCSLWHAVSSGVSSDQTPSSSGCSQSIFLHYSLTNKK